MRVYICIHKDHESFCDALLVLGFCPLTNLTVSALGLCLSVVGGALRKGVASLSTGKSYTVEISTSRQAFLFLEPATGNFSPRYLDQ